MRGRAFGVVAGAIGFVVALAGAVFAGSVAYATTSILVDQGQGAGARPFSAQLTVDALASPTGRLYPGGRSDVVVTIANPNPYPVTVTAISLPHGHGICHRVHHERAHHGPRWLWGRDSERGGLERLGRKQRQLTHARPADHRGGKRAGQQPSDCEVHRCCGDGAGSSRRV